MLTRLLPVALLCATAAQAQNASVTVAIDAAASQHPISPLIYGVAFAAQSDLTALNAPVNRSGGNRTTTYSWKASASNTAADYFYESYPDPSGVPGSSVDAFVSANRAAGAGSIVTVPLIGWVAKLGAEPRAAAEFLGVQIRAAMRRRSLRFRCGGWAAHRLLHAGDGQ